MNTDARFNRQDLFDRFAAIGTGIAREAARNDVERRFDFKHWRQVSEAGLWRLPVPEELGGWGGGWADFAVALEGLASTAQDLGFMISTLGHVGAIRVLVEHGRQEQIDRWLEPLMQGRVGITAMTEAGGGSDLARMRLSATPDGDGWRLSGRKVHITNAPIAGLGMVAGRIPALGSKRDITLFFIDMPSPGLSLGALEDNLGIRTSPTCDIAFDDVRLDGVNIVGEPGDGLAVLYRIISFERALYGAIAAGLIGGMARQALARAEERMSFNRPIADYQYVQGRITEMKAAELTNRVLCAEALSQLDRGAPEASIACSVTKLMAGEQLLSAAEHLVQIHGHLGFMNNALSRQLRDAVGMRIAGGTSDIQRINIFNQMRRIHAAVAADKAPLEAARGAA